MELPDPRKLKFKAWNKETKLLMRLNSIDCVKGELIKKDHILLQFTGLLDSQFEEIYDMDVLLFEKTKYLVQWSGELSGWILLELTGKHQVSHGIKDFTAKAMRLRNYFETE